MLNPAADLPATQAAFEAFFTSQPNWQVSFTWSTHYITACLSLFPNFIFVAIADYGSPVAWGPMLGVNPTRWTFRSVGKQTAVKGL